MSGLGVSEAIAVYRRDASHCSTASPAAAGALLTLAIPTAKKKMDFFPGFIYACLVLDQVILQLTTFSAYSVSLESVMILHLLIWFGFFLILVTCSLLMVNTK